MISFMPDYLNYTFTDSPQFVSTFDELPLWSASFGLLLLKHLELRRDMTVVDIGCGTGFPLFELAERLGNSCKCYGIDPWVYATERAKQKLQNYAVANVEIIEQSAEELFFDSESVDLVVSNLGINNFENPTKVFDECYRVMKKGGRLAITTNLNGHWQTFYDIFEETLKELQMSALVPELKKQQEHRGSVSTISKLFEESGLTVKKHFEDQFSMKFMDGSAFLNHHFVKLGWLASWRDIIPEQNRERVFSKLEENLNRAAHKNGHLELIVPMAYIEGIK